MQSCSDTSEAVELCERYFMYLKPLWKIKISVQLPTLKVAGQTISSWEVMEKLKNMVKPDEFMTLKVIKTNLILIQFEGEVEKKTTQKRVLQKLQTSTMKLSGFPEVLKIRAAPAKLDYPTRHDWDSFFRDAKNVDEMKPGERPDTIYVQNIPIKWFLDYPNSDKPSEYIFKRTFEAFGDIRRIEIPSRNTSSGNQTFGKISSFNQELMFSAYVQYKEYMGFVKAMDSLKGMKLLYKPNDGKAYSADIKVDFDKANYLSDRSIRRRALEAQKIQKDQPPQKEVQEEAKINNAEIEERLQPTPSTSKPTSSASKPKEDIKKSTLSKASKIRKHEAHYLIKELLHRAELADIEKKAKEKEKQIKEERLRQQTLLERGLEEERKRKEEKAKQKQKLLQEQERVLREKLLRSLKAREQQRTEELREKLRKEIAGRKLLKSVLVSKRELRTSDSHNFKKFKL